MMSETPREPTGLPALLLNNRREVAIGLAAVAVLFAVLAIIWGVWGFGRSAADVGPGSIGKLNPDLTEKPVESPDESKRRSPDYQVTTIWAALLAGLSGFSCYWLATQKPDSAAPGTWARIELLIFGGAAGFLTALLGAALGYRWHQSLVQWIGSGESKEAKWVLYAFAIFLVGLILVFVSLQLAGTEQRKNAALRRALYGFNSVFVGILLLLVLIVINVVSFLKVPNTLATNDSAFTSLAEPSKNLLRSLDRPVKAYLLLNEQQQVEIGRGVYGSLYTDCRGLLSQCEDQTNKFEAVYLSPAFDRDRITALMSRLKIREADQNRLGLVITVGEDESTYSFIPAEDLILIEDRSLVFNGENRLMTELMFLSDARANEKIYVIQGYGAPSIDSAGPNERSIAQIVQHLRDRKTTVEPLTLEKADAKIPDDAAVVIVAGPRRTIAESDPLVPALRAYLRKPDRPGKLLAFLPAFRSGPEGKVGATGLESLLGEFGVDVDGRNRVVAAPKQIRLPESFVIGRAVERIENDTLARAVGEIQMIFQDVRVVRPAPAMQGAPTVASPVFRTDLITWLEDDYVSFSASYDLLRSENGGAARRDKQYNQFSKSMGVAVAKPAGRGADKSPAKPQMVVLGSDTFLLDKQPVPTDDAIRQQLFSDLIDWLRERDSAVGISPRKVAVYSIEKPIEWSSQFVLLGMVTIGIVVLGGGVWLSRRR